jgi:CxxC motif-containing protein (DUF1111 family)
MLPRTAAQLLIGSLCLAPALAWLEPPAGATAAALSSGALSVADTSEFAYAHALTGLDAQQGELFALGRRMFNNRWAFFWFENAEFGRGPTSNAQSCSICHANNGRGVAPGTPQRPPANAKGEPRDHHIPVPYEAALNLVVRLSLKEPGPNGAPQPHPHYGEQLQNFGVKGVVAPEGQIEVEWRERGVTLPDGEQVSLRAPLITFKQLAYGPLGENTLTGARLAPPLVGLGLLEAVPEQTILALAERAPIDGIRGRANRVWDESQGKLMLGRFGLKANHGSLREQIAAAFIGDLGLSSPVYREQNCPPIQDGCKEQMTAGDPEITALRLAATELYVRALAVPMRRNIDDAQVKRGERLFEAAHCAACHVPELKTGEFPPMPQLAQQTIHPYTDLLLHDMGEELSDDRPDFAASGSQWRTPPLWGIGLSETVNGAGAFLHDGRARNFTEAILWHGGEAAVAREAFSELEREDRAALLAFLQSL